MMPFRNISLAPRISAMVLFLVALTGLWWVVDQQGDRREDYRHEAEADLQTALKVKNERLTHAIEALRQNTLFLAALPPVSGIARASLHQGFDPRDRDSYSTWEARLQQIFSDFLITHPDYSRVRYIGIADNGLELVCVEKRGGRIEVTPHQALESRDRRDYFQAALDLPVGQVGFSSFSLEQANGKLVQPYRRKLRAMTPVFDENGQRFGMIVLDREVASLLGMVLQGLPSGVEAYVADRQGRYLLHPDTRRDFEFENGSGQKITDDFPLLTAFFRAEPSQELPLRLLADGSYLTAERIAFDAQDPARFLLLAYRVPPAVVAEHTNGIDWQDMVEAIFLGILFSALLMLILRRTFEPLKRITQAAEKIAAGNRQLRLEETGGGELKQLSQTLNLMLDKLADRELIKQENAFRKELIESLPGVFYMIDSEGKFLLWNRNLERVFCCSADELRQHHSLDFLEGEDKAKVELASRRVFEGMEDMDIEAMLVALDGTRTPYHFTGRRIRHEGRWVLVGLGMDISARRRADEAMRIAAITFETHDAIMITDAAANIIKVNRAFTEITGYRSEEVIGQNPRLMSSGKHEPSFYAGMWQELLTTGSWRGEIWDRRKNGELYPKWMAITAIADELGKTTQYVAIFSDITARKQAEREIHNLAFYDALTQLPNRRLLDERLNQALLASKRSGSHGALMFLDLDNFKPLNDRHGHVVGDLLLIEVACRLRGCVREVDTVSRFGGDEFVVMLCELGSSESESIAEAGRVAEKIRQSLSAPYLLRGGEEGEAGETVEHRSAASIGVALFNGLNGTQDDIMKWADAAMYQAKATGRNSVCFYPAALD